MILQLDYDSCGIPLSNQLHKKGFKFISEDAEITATTTIHHLDFLYIQGIITDSEKYKSLIRLDKYVKKNIESL